MPVNDIETFCPANRQEWRRWLKKHGQSKQSVWLVYHKKNTGVPTLSWSEAVEEALCFGWIDGRGQTIDDKTFRHLFSKRQPKSTWSKVNKEKVEWLIEKGMMTKAGLEVIETAKQNGSWTILDEVEAFVIPKDLSKAFRAHKGSKAYFLGLSKSVRKAMLAWVVLARLPVTRQRRIDAIASLAALQQKPTQF